MCGAGKKKAYNLIKRELSLPNVLALYNPKSDFKISPNTSSYGLGAVLLQKQQNTG